jgi:hypothetical protein
MMVPWENDPCNMRPLDRKSAIRGSGWRALFEGAAREGFARNIETLP